MMFKIKSVLIGLTALSTATIIECAVFLKLGGQDLTVTHGNKVLLYCRAPEISTLKLLIGKQGNVHISLSDTTWSRFIFLWNGINKGFGLIPTSKRETQCQYLVRFIRTVAGTSSVTVLSAPDKGSPACAMDTPSSHVHVGDTIQLKCTSSGGNPPAELQWVSESRKLQEISIRQTALTHLLEPSDNGVIFTCLAQSRAMDRPRTCSIQPLNIQPTVQIVPVTNLVQVEESAVFKCKGDGVPRINRYQWYFGDQLITSNTARIRKVGRELHLEEVFWRDHNVIVRCVVATQNGLTANTTGVLRVVYDLEPTALHAVPNGGNGYTIPYTHTDPPTTKSANSLVLLIGLGVCGLLFGTGTIMTYIVYIKISKKNEKMQEIPLPLRRGHAYQMAQRSTRHQRNKSTITISSKSEGINIEQCSTQTKTNCKRPSTNISCNLERVPSEAYKRNHSLSAINEGHFSYEAIRRLHDESCYYDFSGEHDLGIEYDDVSIASKQSHSDAKTDGDDFYEALRPESEFLDDEDINEIIETAMRRASLNGDARLFYIGSKSWAL